MGNKKIGKIEKTMDADLTIAEYKKQMKVTGYAQRTIDLYGWGLNGFKGYLQDQQIGDLRKVNHQTILDYQAQVRSEPTAVETSAIKIRAVKRLFEHLTDAHRLLINPTEGIVETNRQKRKIGTVLTVAEMKTLLDQPNLSLPMQIRDKAIMEVLYCTGIRSDELLNLQVYDADLKDKVLFIGKGKGKKQRIVPLGRKAVTYLKEYLQNIRPRCAGKNPKERTMFLNQQGRPLTWNCIRVRINEYRLKAGIKKSIGLHAFRRSCATHMLQQGADIRYIQKLLGHKYLKTTQLYTKVMPTDVKKTHDKTHPGVKGKRRKAKGQRLKKDKNHED